MGARSLPFVREVFLQDRAVDPLGFTVRRTAPLKRRDYELADV